MDQLETPVALFIFNRPETTGRVLDRIRQVRPKCMFVIADGPRSDRGEEARLCKLTRDLIGTIDWPCEVKTNFSDVNLGCGRRMSSGISWVFDHTPEAIFLEDDCLPSPGFFEFCSTLLERYRNDGRIGMISGDCFLPSDMECPDSYYFSRYPHIWGWASWRRAWAYYDFALTRYPLDSTAFTYHFGSPEVGQYFRGHCIDIREGRTDTWDYQITYSFVRNSLLTIIPSRNLVSNIGFGAAATHTHDGASPHANMPAHEPDHPIRHPTSVRPWDEADRYTERNVFGIQSEPTRESANEDINSDEDLPAEPGVELWHTLDNASIYTRVKSRLLTAITETQDKRNSDRRTTALLVDPGLYMMGGHNYSALLRLKTELDELNVEYTCLAATASDAAVRELAKPVLPPKGLWWRESYTRQEFVQHAKVMKDELSRALNELRRPPDLLILHCGDSVQVRALAEYYGRSSQIPPPHVILWLLFTPNRFKPMGDLSTTVQIDEYRDAFADLRRAVGNDRKISVFCETAALATAYKDIIGIDIGVAPCPNLAGTGGKKVRTRRAPTWKIVTLGHANEAKGYHLLPDAIRQVLNADSRADFFIHGMLDGADTVSGAAVFDDLSKMGPRVVISNEFLTSEQYLSCLLETDLLLLPYDNKAYETRGSGIFNEAKEIGIPVVATRGCAFVRPAFDEGWGVEIIERSSSGLAQAILAALQRLPDLSACAREAATKRYADDAGTILRKVVEDIRPGERLARAVAVKDSRGTRKKTLPMSFFTSVTLQEGVSVRDDSSVGVISSVSTRPTDKKPSIPSIVGKRIDTTSIPYRYSIVLAADKRKTWKRPSGSLLATEVSIEVLAGRVSVVWVDENFQVVGDAERYAPAMPGIQKLFVPVSNDRAYHLVFRNFTSDATPTSFRILELKVTLRKNAISRTPERLLLKRHDTAALLKTPSIRDAN